MKNINEKRCCFCSLCKIIVKAIILTVWLLAAIILIVCKFNYYFSYPVEQEVQILDFTSDYNPPSISIHVTPKSDSGNLSEKAFTDVNSWFEEIQKYPSIFESCVTNYENETEVDCKKVTNINQSLSRSYNTFTFSFGSRIQRNSADTFDDRCLMKFKMKTASIRENWIAISVNKKLVYPTMEPKMKDTNFLKISKNSLQSIVTFSELEISRLPQPYSTNCNQQNSDYEDRGHCAALCFERSYRDRKQWPAFVSTLQKDKNKGLLVNVSDPDRDIVKRCDTKCSKHSCNEKKYDLSLKYREPASGETIEVYVYRKSTPNIRIVFRPMYKFAQLLLYCGALISFTLGFTFIIFRI